LRGDRETLGKEGISGVRFSFFSSFLVSQSTRRWFLVQYGAGQYLSFPSCVCRYTGAGKSTRRKSVTLQIRNSGKQRTDDSRLVESNA
jgi:hypothetical protein